MFKMSYMLPLRGGERPGTTDVWNLLQGGVEIATVSGSSRGGMETVER
jgi:hypothetical protein